MSVCSGGHSPGTSRTQVNTHLNDYGLGQDVVGVDPRLDDEGRFGENNGEGYHRQFMTITRPTHQCFGVLNRLIGLATKGKSQNQMTKLFILT